MRINLWHGLRRRPWLAVAGLAGAGVMVIGAVAMTDPSQPASAPPMALVGETSTPEPTATGSPTQTGGPAPTASPTGGPTSSPPADPDEDGPCDGGASFDGDSRDWRASVTCDGFGAQVLLEGHYSTRGEAQQAGQDWASHMNKSGGMVKAGPGCDPPLVFC